MAKFGDESALIKLHIQQRKRGTQLKDSKLIQRVEVKNEWSGKSKLTVTFGKARLEQELSSR